MMEPIDMTAFVADVRTLAGRHGLDIAADVGQLVLMLHDRPESPFLVIEAEPVVARDGSLHVSLDITVASAYASIAPIDQDRLAHADEHHRKDYGLGSRYRSGLWRVSPHVSLVDWSTWDAPLITSLYEGDHRTWFSLGDGEPEENKRDAIAATHTVSRWFHPLVTHALTGPVSRARLLIVGPLYRYDLQRGMRPVDGWFSGEVLLGLPGAA